MRERVAEFVRTCLRGRFSWLKYRAGVIPSTLDKRLCCHPMWRNAARSNTARLALSSASSGSLSATQILPGHWGRARGEIFLTRVFARPVSSHVHSAHGQLEQGG